MRKYRTGNGGLSPVIPVISAIATFRLLALLAALALSAASHAQSAFVASTSASAAAPPAGIMHIGAGGSDSRNNCGNINPGIPGGAVNDLLIALVNVREESAVVTMAGWNQLYTDTYPGLSGGNQEMVVHVFWRLATGGDPNTINQAGTCSSIAAEISRFRGVDTAQPFYNNPIPAGNVVRQDSGNLDTGTETTTLDNSMLLVAGFINDNRTVNAGAGWSQSFDNSLNITRDLGLSLHYMLQGAAGPASVANWDLSGGGSDENYGIIFALRPAPEFSINVPAGTAANDVMVAAVAVRVNSIAITAPAGWTLVRETVNALGGGLTSRMATWYRVAGGAEPASYAWSFSGGAHSGAVGAIATFRNVDTEFPVNAEDGAATPVSGDHTAPSISPGVINTMLVGAFEFTSATDAWLATGGMTSTQEVTSVAAPSDLGIAMLLAYQTNAAAGATGTRTASANVEPPAANANADLGVAHLLALRPRVAHYAIGAVATTVATCEYAEITINAHNGSHGTVYPPANRIVTLSTSSATGVWLAPLVSGGGIWTPSGANNGAATYQWSGGESSFTVRLRHNTPIGPISINLLDNRGAVEAGIEDPGITYADSVLRVTADGSTSANLGTQIAGKRSDTGFGAQTLFVQAIATAPATGNCTTLFQNQTLNVDFAAQCNNPAACSLAAGTEAEVLNSGGSVVSVAKNNGPGAPATYTPVSLTFSNDANAMAPLVLRYGDAGQVTLFMRAPLPAPPAGTFASGTSNAFVVRPFGIAFRGATAGTPIQHGVDQNSALLAPAGDNFTMTVAAYRWVMAEDDGTGNPLPGANITDNGLTPNFASSTTVAPSANLPGVALGAMARGVACASAATIAPGSFSGGSATVTDWCYSEVGNVLLSATATNYITAGITVTGNSGLDGTGAASGHVGRFRPKQFELDTVITPPTLTNRSALACASSFSYMGESIGLTFRLFARNTQGATTQNYNGVYAKLNPASATVYNFGARSGTTDLTSRLSASYPGAVPAWANGVLNIPSTDPVYVSVGRATPDNPDGPYAGLQFGIAPDDADPAPGSGVQMNTLDFDVNNDTIVDHKNLGVSAEVRFGRLRLNNANGSQLVALSMLMEAQYWNGSSFITNTADNCTTVTAPNVGLGNYTGSLGAGDTTPTIIPAGPFSAGRKNLTLSAPGGTKTGTVDMVVNLNVPLGAINTCTPILPAPVTTGADLTYLRGKWCGASFDREPTARARFGVYKGSEEVIHIRENY